MYRKAARGGVGAAIAEYLRVGVEVQCLPDSHIKQSHPNSHSHKSHQAVRAKQSELAPTSSPPPAAKDVS